MDRVRGDYGGGSDAVVEPSRQRLDRHYRRYADWLGRAIRHRFASPAVEVEDVVQEAYLRLARYADEGRDHAPRALLLQIASNIARDALRRADVRRRIVVAIDEEPVEGRIDADQAEQLQLKQIILALPPHLREVFLLSRFTTMSHAEIARHCGISVKTVEWRMGKALALCDAALDR
jgi:RNA polymerase sigma-70 factor (ECF subfamily)